MASIDLHGHWRESPTASQVLLDWPCVFSSPQIRQEIREGFKRPRVCITTLQHEVKKSPAPHLTHKPFGLQPNPATYLIQKKLW